VNIIDALTLRAGDSRYALPIDQVVANIGLPRDDIRAAFDRDRHFLYQGGVVPLYRLREVLEQTPADDDESGGILPVIILRGRTGPAAFEVSEFLGPQKLVNIPLDEDVEHHPAVAGTAVFTGGKLGLTVDVDLLVAHALGDADLVAATAAIDTGPARTLVDASSPSPAETPAPAAAESARPAAAASPADGDEADDLRRELQSSLQKLQDTLLSLEADPTNADLLHAAFRRLHAVKGHFTMLDAESTAALAHHLETVLDYLRAERLVLTPERMDAILDGVSHLQAAADQLPGVPSDPPAALLTTLQELVDTDVVGSEDGLSLGDLVRQPFDLSPTAQLQVLSALKRGERTYETYLRFDPGRQPGFLAAYLLLRRVGKSGTVMATLPSADDIEQGRCGRELKILWSTPLPEPQVDQLFAHLAQLYNLHEHQTIPTTIFRYEGGA
jgi:chemotaxis protein histidine kinase CheA